MPPSEAVSCDLFLDIAQSEPTSEPRRATPATRHKTFVSNYTTPRYNEYDIPRVVSGPADLPSSPSSSRLSRAQEPPAFAGHTAQERFRLRIESRVGKTLQDSEISARQNVDSDPQSFSLMQRLEHARADNYHLPYRQSSSSPVVLHSDRLSVSLYRDHPTSTPYSQDGKESVTSDAPTTVWDEIDDLRSRLRRIESVRPLITRWRHERSDTAITDATSSQLSQKDHRQAASPAGTLTGKSNTFSLQQELQAALALAHPTLDDNTYRAIDSSADDATAVLFLLNNLDVDSVERNDLQMSLKRLRRRSEDLLGNLTDLCRALNRDDHSNMNRHALHDSMPPWSRSASYSEYNSSRMNLAPRPTREQWLLNGRAESSLSVMPGQELVQYVPKTEARHSSPPSRAHMTAGNELPSSGKEYNYIRADGRPAPHLLIRLASVRRSQRHSVDHGESIHVLSESPQRQEWQHGSKNYTSFQSNGNRELFTSHVRPVAWQTRQERDSARLPSVARMSLAERIERRHENKDGGLHTVVDDTHEMNVPDGIPGLAR